jgi:hypothetical protein
MQLNLGKIGIRDNPNGRQILKDGWWMKTGAVLLREFLRGYHGDRDRFAIIASYESAVNGRGIPDLDLSSYDDERIRQRV